MKKRWLLPVFASFMLLAGPFTDQVDAATNADVTSTAYNYLGTPYLYGGTTASGFDCSGFVQKVYADLGYSIGRTTYAQFEQGSAVAQGNLIAGDLVFFNTGGGVSHVGIYIGSGQFIHSASNVGVTVSNLGDPYYWAPRYVGARRILSVSNEVNQETKQTKKEEQVVKETQNKNEKEKKSKKEENKQEQQEIQQVTQGVIETKQEQVIATQNQQQVIQNEEKQIANEDQEDPVTSKRQIDLSILNVAYPVLEPSISDETSSDENYAITNELYKLGICLGYRKMSI